MVIEVQPWLCPSFILLLFSSSSSVLSLSSVNQYSSQNTAISTETLSSIQYLEMPVPPPPPPPPPPLPPSPSNRKVVVAVIATATIILIIVAIIFFFCHKYGRCRQKNKTSKSFKQEGIVTSEEFRKFGGRVKGLIVDENGRDVVYVKDLGDKKLESKFSKILSNPSYEEEKRADVTIKRPRKCKPQEVKNSHGKEIESVQPKQEPPAIVSLIGSSALHSPSSSLRKKVLALPSPVETKPPPPPPPPPPSPPLPLPPPPLLPPLVMAKKPSIPPPPPPWAGVLVSSIRPPPAPRGNTNNKSGVQASTEGCSKGTNVGQMKLKALHWDKVIANADHSMVWNEIIDGSLRYSTFKV